MLIDKHPNTKGRTGAGPTTTLLEEVDKCRAYLHIGGFLSEGENAKIKHRIGKWCKKFEGKVAMVDPNEI